MDAAKRKEAFLAWIEDPNAQEIPFDLKAQDPNDWAWLAEHIPGIVISSAGGVWPFTAEGLLHGLPFYYHDEQGHASLSVGTADGNAYLNDRIYGAGISTGKDWEAHPEAFPRLLAELVTKLEPVQFYWQFRRNRVDQDENGNFIVVESKSGFDYAGGRGDTPVEAYFAALENMVVFAEEHLPGREQEWLEACDLSREPLNWDTRVFPYPAPNFTVN